MSAKRQPRGIPVGGQFAANEHDEASASLSAPSVVATEQQAQAYASALSWGYSWMHKEAQQAADDIVKKQADYPSADADEINDLLVKDYEKQNGSAFSPEGHRQQRRAVHAVLGQEMKPYRPLRRSDAARGDIFTVLGGRGEIGRSPVAVRRVTAAQITDHMGDRWSIATGREVGGTRTLVPAAAEDGDPR